MKRILSSAVNFILICNLFFLFSFESCKSPTAPKSNNIPDTTNHNWVFTIDTLGEGNGSTLHDVAIVSTNPPLVYAVGEIYLKDSTGQFDQNAYSIAIWNGQNWGLKRIYDIDNSLIPSIRGIYIFNQYDIWLADGGVYRWDGKSQKVISSFGRISLIGGVENGQSVNKFWGTSSNNLYGVGWKGMVTYYNGNSWQKLSSGTSTDIQDICGYQNTSGQTTILCVSSTVYYGGDESLFSISGNNVKQLNTSGLSWSERGLWFDDKGYYIVGDGMYYKKTLQDTVWQSFQKGLTTYYIEAIRGNAPNDIVAVGDYGAFLHFNGSSWYNFTQQLNLSGCDFYSVSIKGDLVVAVGTIGGDRGIVVVGVRK